MYSNSAVKEILGYAPEEVLGRRYFDLFTPVERKRVTEAAYRRRFANPLRPAPQPLPTSRRSRGHYRIDRYTATRCRRQHRQVAWCGP